MVTGFVLNFRRVLENLCLLVLSVIQEFVFYFCYADLEAAVKVIDEGSSPISRVELALECLPSHQKSVDLPFRYWRIRDYAHAYRHESITPLDVSSLYPFPMLQILQVNLSNIYAFQVAEHLIRAIEDSQKRKVPMSLFISFDAEVVRKQAAESSRRFSEG